ncbi:MAG: hypothetical protein H5U17_02395 [Defluviimonas sp.]|nr:hypothetical protein [Defluviimonas sp.]
MVRLFLIIYTLAATVLAGSAVVAALTMGRVDAVSIIVAAVAGAVVALPVSWLVVRTLQQQA